MIRTVVTKDIELFDVFLPGPVICSGKSGQIDIPRGIELEALFYVSLFSQEFLNIGDRHVPLSGRHGSITGTTDACELIS